MVDDDKDLDSQTQVRPGHVVFDITSYIKGWRLRAITISLSVYLFLQNLEIPIVVTSLVSITDDIHGFNQAYWIVSAYLMGYVGFLIILAKLSDIFGRKSILLIDFTFFIIFSAVCGAAQTFTQLVVFRAFQGIGAAGYTLCSIIFVELIPEEKYVKYNASMSLVYALSLSLGPLLGGIINDHGSWRWVFLLNVPIGVPALLAIVYCLPNGFPYHDKRLQDRGEHTRAGSKDIFKSLDIPGALLILLATLSIVAALEESGHRYGWGSALIISLLSVSGVLWIAFFSWEWSITKSSGRMQPIFPWRLAKNRPYMGLILNGGCLGAVWFITLFELPQKFQVVYGASPTRAGLHLLPFTLACPLGGVIVSVIAKTKVPPLYLLLCGSIVQVIAYSLLGTLPTPTRTSSLEYGLEVLAGIGVGANISLGTLMIPFLVEGRDKAVALGTLPQFRIIGGAVGVAVSTSVMTHVLKSSLGQQLGAAGLDALLNSAQSLEDAPSEVQQLVKLTMAHGYRTLMKITCGLAAGQVLGCLVMWQRDQIKV